MTGTAPLDASSGEQSRHRLSRAGDRRVNHMIHIAAISQIRLDTDGRAHYRRKRAAGKPPLEAIRCRKRRISDAIYRQAGRRRRSRRTSTHAGGPGRAMRGVSRIQRGRLTPAHRHFGSATSLTRNNDATPHHGGREDQARHAPPADRLTTGGSRSDARQPKARQALSGRSREFLRRSVVSAAKRDRPPRPEFFEVLRCIPVASGPVC
jgi:hypothetical protein